MEINWQEVTSNTKYKKRWEKDVIISQMKTLKISKNKVNVSELSRQTGISRVTLSKWLKEIE